MNVDRMRRTLERSKADAARRERIEWLAAMTPEHRAKHEIPNPFGGFCGECIQENGLRFADAIGSMRTAMIKTR